MANKAAVEQLGSYVYYLQDPRNDKVFYVGKGSGDRVFDHLESAIETNGETEKLDIIRNIIESGHEVEHFILRHGLTEKEAFEIEAAMIDFVGRDNLSNHQSGHDADARGLQKMEAILAKNAEELSTTEPIILININKFYRRSMTVAALYEVTRKAWVVGLRKGNAKYAVATFRGLTIAVYEIHQWYPEEQSSRPGGRAKVRWGFYGTLANEDISQKLLYKSIGHLFKKGAQNPIKYLNC